MSSLPKHIINGCLGQRHADSHFPSVEVQRQDSAEPFRSLDTCSSEMVARQVKKNPRRMRDGVFLLRWVKSKALFNILCSAQWATDGDQHHSGMRGQSQYICHLSQLWRWPIALQQLQNIYSTHMEGTIYLISSILADFNCRNPPSKSSVRSCHCHLPGSDVCQRSSGAKSAKPASPVSVSHRSLVFAKDHLKAMAVVFGEACLHR